MTIHSTKEKAASGATETALQNKFNQLNYIKTGFFCIDACLIGVTTLLVVTALLQLGVA